MIPSAVFQVLGQSLVRAGISGLLGAQLLPLAGGLGVSPELAKQLCGHAPRRAKRP